MNYYHLQNQINQLLYFTVYFSVMLDRIQYLP